MALLQSSTDTGRLRTLKAMVLAWQDVDTDSAFACAMQLKTISHRARFAEGVIYADVKLAEMHNFNGNFSDAMKLNMQNLAYANSHGTPLQQADVLKTIAMSYSMQGINDSALHYYLSALRIYEDKHDSLQMAKVMVNMGVVYDHMGEVDRSIQYCERAKEIFRHRDLRAYLVTLTNLALYRAFEKQYEQAKTYYGEALEIARRENNYNSQAHIYAGLTDIAYLQRQFPLMIEYARSFEQVARVMKVDHVIARSKLAMAKALFFNEQFAEAENYLNDLLEHSSNVEDLDMLQDIYAIYSYVLLGKGRLSGFVEVRQRIDSLNQLRNKELITRATKDLELKYETEKKDNLILRQDADLRQKRLWNYLLTGIGLASVLVAGLLFSNVRHRQKLYDQERLVHQQEIARLEHEKQLDAARALLQGQDEERSRLAKDLHDGVGGMLNGVRFAFTHLRESMPMSEEYQAAFARNMDLLQGSIFELRRVAQNMMPESLMRFGLDASLRDLCAYFEGMGGPSINYQGLRLRDLQIDKAVSMSIYRIVQELLTNIQKHAGASEVLVQVAYDDGHVSITVEDNGVGFDVDRLQAGAAGKGMGWSNIQNRVDTLRGRVQVTSSPQSGTTVQVDFEV